MSNDVYVSFKREETYSVNGDLLHDYWVAKVWDDNSIHDFDYESFDEMKEHWRPENVIQNLKEFDILEDFQTVLESKKGFYYPSEYLISKWIEIDIKEIENGNYNDQERE